MPELTIKNGQFLRGEEIVKPVFGDLEQIKALRVEVEKQERLHGAISKIEKYYTYDSVFDEYSIFAEFKCKCGSDVKYEATGYEEEEDVVVHLEFELEMNSCECNKCGQEYEFILDNNILKAALVK